MDWDANFTGLLYLIWFQKRLIYLLTRDVNFSLKLPTKALLKIFVHKFSSLLLLRKKKKFAKKNFISKSNFRKWRSVYWRSLPYHCTENQLLIKKYCYGGIFRSLPNIYNGLFFWTEWMIFSRELLLQKRAIIDAWRGP